MNFLMDSFKLILASAIGIFIGVDQKHRGKEAGPKTHSLVCLGSTLAVLAGGYIGGDASARIASQIVTGVGFLGAGVILVKNDFQIHGLTTAAGIWLVACLGITVATDGWPLALVGTLIWFVITHFFAYHEEKMKVENDKGEKND